MKILYDHQIFTNQRYGGISRYFYEIIVRLDKLNDAQIKIPIWLSNNYYLSSRKYIEYHNFFPNKEFKGKQALMSVINKINTINCIKKQDFDLFHPTYYDTYFLKYLKGQQFVLTVYDMIHERFSDMFPDSYTITKNKKKLCEEASKIIAISKNTKKDLIKLFGIKPSKIEVVYLANSLALNGQIKLNIKLPSRYILFVGSRGGYKNFIIFIKSIVRLLNVQKNLSVVCVGGGRFNEKEKKLFKELKISNRVLQYDLNDEYLALFYKKAEIFVFPSLYEGFGIPILEAFSCNCPVVCSKTSSLPEVAGNGAEYFNPYNENSIYMAVKTILNNKEKRRKIIENGKKQLKFFSWEKTMEKTKQIYKMILT